MQVPIQHPELTATQLPAGIDVAAVVNRKRAMMATGTPAATAEANAIQAEQIQLDRDAHHAGPHGVKDAQNRGPAHVYRQTPTPSEPSESTP